VYHPHPMEEFACKVASWTGSPVAIIGQVVVTGLAFWFLGVDATTLVLSVEAITLSQLVLVAQSRTERHVLHALSELVRAVPDADDRVADEVEAEGPN
jgi:uncharacterized membrane protein